MLRAERIYRNELAKVSIADVLIDLRAKDTNGAIAARGCAFLKLNERRRNSN